MEDPDRKVSLQWTHRMLAQGEGTLEILEAKLADVELGEGGVVSRVGGGVPGVHLVQTKLDGLQTVVGNVDVRGVSGLPRGFLALNRTPLVNQDTACDLGHLL